MHLSAQFQVRRWGKHAEVRSPELENVARFAIRDFEPELMRLWQQSANFFVRNSFWQPEFARAEISDECRHAAHVVGVGVREGNRANASIQHQCLWRRRQIRLQQSGESARGYPRVEGLPDPSRFRRCLVAQCLQLRLVLWPG